MSQPPPFNLYSNMLCGALPSLFPSPCFPLSSLCALFYSVGAGLMMGGHVAEALVLIGCLPIFLIFKEVVAARGAVLLIPSI